MQNKEWMFAVNHCYIGLDYGSLSARGVLADGQGRMLAEAEFPYPHGVMMGALPDGTALQGEFCLQHPGDYTAALFSIIPALLQKSGVPKERIAGLGVDFTTSTILPVDSSFCPLCLLPEWEKRPHAWVKMWKHQGAHAQAKRLNDVCRAQNSPWLPRYGGAVNAQCLMAKVIQVFDEDKELFEKAHCFLEAGDYITSLLTGAPAFSLSLAAAKAFLQESYPDESFFAALHPGLKNLPREKLMDRFPEAKKGFPGEAVGRLCGEMAERLGLCSGISVSAAQMDSYAPVAGMGITEPGTMLMVMGTSTGILLLSEKETPVEGVTACLKNTLYPGLYAYGSGQSSVGDAFQWFVDQCVPEAYHQAAKEKGLSLHGYLTELAAPLAPGETGLIALDWLGGNRSCLANSRLSGMILGLTLKTKPEHIYRALMEATAFGARVIVEAYEKAGVPVREIVICGGIAVKNPFLMQLYADILGRPLRVSRCAQAPALGSAIYAAAAAGKEKGFPDLFSAVRAMRAGDFLHYAPDAARHAAYAPLYREYLRLHDYFGRGGNQVMERIRK